MAKRTHASVTAEPCDCDYLQQAAEDPRVPITFDTRTSEYQFSYDSGMLMIYHCPFCGGAAPKSKRSLLFAQIPVPEENRLAKMLGHIATIDDALRTLGKPDFDGYSASKCSEHDNEAPLVRHHRDIRYHQLSDVAEVWITERPDGKVAWHLQGKYLGDKSA